MYSSPGCMHLKQYTELLYPHLLSFSVSALKIYQQDQTCVCGIVENNVEKRLNQPSHTEPFSLAIFYSLLERSFYIAPDIP